MPEREGSMDGSGGAAGERPGGIRSTPGAEAGHPRNLVVMCDGTGNSVDGDLSNVLKLYRIARKDERQRVFYDPGIGTVGMESSWARLRQNARAAFGLATGAGLDGNALEAYSFLCGAWRLGDRIMLFGFSRGAYTVRMLAGLIHMIGLLRPDQLNLCGNALRAYKRSAERDDLHIAWDFQRVVGSRTATIHFMGLWDTVASMIVPRPDRLYIPSLQQLPYTRTNPSVRAVRHAMAIDERRRMFRLNRWIEPQPFVEDRFAHPRAEVPQDVAQMWFAGVHADIGGGYPEKESGLSKFPLAWMVDEAAAHGLEIDRAMADHLALGAPLAGGRHDYVPPDATAEAHRSLGAAWWPLELLPKRSRWRETRARSVLGLYLPLGERRRIRPGDLIHPSVTERRRLIGYHPANLFAESSTEPTPDGARDAAPSE